MDVSKTTIDLDACNLEEFVAALQALRTEHRFTYQRLADAIGRPKATVHGWCSGQHLPYAREEADFEAVLLLLGIDAPVDWMTAIARFRRRT